MKIFKITVLLLFCTIIIQAQEDFKHSLSGIKKVKFITNTSVKVSVGKSNELIIGEMKKSENYYYRTDKDRKKREDKAKGLTAIYSEGTDNTGQGLFMEIDGDVLILKDLKSFMQRSGFTIQLPQGIDLSLDCGNLGGADINGLSSDIEVKTNVGQINLMDITGPVTASTATGYITAVFSKVSQSSPISLRSATGDVDVSISSNTKANLKLKSTLGRSFTDFDFETETEDGMKVIGGYREIITKINNGGVKISLSSATGNVYLRKK